MAKPVNVTLSAHQISVLLSPFSVALSAKQFSQINEYVAILLKWNTLISLTTVTDPQEIVSRHFGESMFLPSLLRLENGRLADVGSGAGFPGLALKILCPALNVVLVESNKKKSAFLAEIVRSLDLHGVEIIPTRYDEIRSKSGFADFVTARALGGFPDLLQWARGSLSERGHVALWVGGEDTTVISNVAGWIWQPAALLPGAQRRFILIGRPLRS